jgi:mono/diheme cytochrome c family protein
LKIMKSATFALVIVCGAIGGSFARAAAAQTPRTTWNGIYTDAQAKRGQAVYEEQCLSCHSPDLKGADQAPALVGPDFNANWNDVAINDLFERIRTSMPADKPGTLKPEQVADVVALLLSKNGFPAGDSELPPQGDVLKDIKFLSKQP